MKKYVMWIVAGFLGLLNLTTSNEVRIASEEEIQVAGENCSSGSAGSGVGHQK